jgi:protein-tyrosine-phosphatase
MFIAPNVKLALKELGIKKVDNTPRKLKQEDLRNANIILNLASEIKLKIKNKKYKKIYNWHISDTDSKDYSGILKRAKLIKTKIIKLLREIN